MLSTSLDPEAALRGAFQNHARNGNRRRLQLPVSYIELSFVQKTVWQHLPRYGFFLSVDSEYRQADTNDVKSKIQGNEELTPGQQRPTPAGSPSGGLLVDHSRQPSHQGNGIELVQPSHPPSGGDRPVVGTGYGRLRMWLSNLKEKWSLQWSLLTFLSLAALAVIIALAVLYASLKKRQPPSLTITTPLVGGALPIVDAGLGAAAVVLGTFFSPTKQHVKVVYDGGGKLCIRTEDPSWRNSVQCVEGADPKKGTPLTMLDWIGGPTVFFVTARNFLSSIDNAYTNDTWKLSNLIDSRIEVHEQSQLASITFLNGTAGRVHFQSPSLMLREYGKYDYRDEIWSSGSTGDLGRSRIGTGIAAIRRFEGENEVEELFSESDSGVLQGRIFANSAWDLEPFSVDYTLKNVSTGSSIGAATVKQGNDSVVLLAYGGSTGFLTVQTRKTTNLSRSDYHAFTPPIQLVQGDGRPRTGLAAISWQDQARLYFVNENKILELSSANASTANWTTATVPF
ncbi:MAG: hypothetical protein M1813_000580 [Trichoglossum hirsutum]|nr:MAG: hypothetical protein M1813_000580 [Trichoglossum hirsutum]